jgi:hypothetical protein
LPRIINDLNYRTGYFGERHLGERYFPNTGWFFLPLPLILKGEVNEIKTDYNGSSGLTFD